ncbi:MAG: aldo/keto reductase [Myxococcota bacterium]
MAVLGLGLAALGRPGYMTLGHASDFPSTSVEAMRTRTFAVLDAAWAAGVRHFDAARSYGRAEEFLAEWLRARGHRELFVSSKWGYRYTADWQSTAAVHEVKDHSLAQLERQWPESRALLGGWLSLYQVHSATLESGVLADAAVHARLAQLRAEAGVKLGLSVTGPRQAEVIDAALRVTVDGQRLFDSVQATWNVLEPSAGPALQRAHDAGLLVIVKEGVANGRLSPRSDVPGWLALARGRGVSPDALALAVVLAQPFVDVVLSGAATIAQLESNLAARNLDAREVKVADFRLEPARFWSERAKLAWT